MDPIRHELNINAATDKVKAAVSTAAGQRGWWSTDSDVAEEVGGTVEMRFHKDGGLITMVFRVDALEDNRVQWTCTENGNPIWIGSTLTWSWEAKGDRTALKFAHEGLTQGGPPYEMTKGGWQHFMSSLQAYCETGTGEPWG